MATTSELLLAQLVAESYVQASLNDPDDRFRLGNNNPGNSAYVPRAEVLPGATRMTDRQITRFNELYSVVDHRTNTWSGFSATLLQRRGSNEFVLSFRSTEYQNDTDGGDFQRDGLGGAEKWPRKSEQRYKWKLWV